MKALLCAAVIATTAVVSGCAAPRHSLSVADAHAVPQATCNQVTGSRTGASPLRQDCTPVGYPFRQFSLDDIRALGANDINRLFQPRY